MKHRDTSICRAALESREPLAYPPPDQAGMLGPVQALQLSPDVLREMIADYRRR
jgi:hypothetical protein